MRRLLKSTTLALALALAWAPGWAATDVESPQGLLKGQVPDDLPALKRVAITTFFVQYVTDFGIETKRKRGGSFYSKWKEPSPEALQATTDALYTQLVADLKAAGVEVVAGDQVDAQEAMAELRAVGRPSPARVDDNTLRKTSTLVTARKLPLVLATLPDAKLPSYATRPLEGTDPPGNLMGWDKQASDWLLGSNLELRSLSTIYFGQAKIAQNLNATALNVRLAVALVDMGVTTCGNVHGWVAGLAGCESYADVTGLIKPNPRFVEAGTVFSFSQAGGNPGHRHVVALQKPVPIAGLKVTSDPERKSLDHSLFGVRSSRGSGLLGALMGGAGVNKDEADFWISVDAAGLEPALTAAGSTVFKELAQMLVNAK
jgi:hypothetical protein